MRRATGRVLRAKTGWAKPPSVEVLRDVGWIERDAPTLFVALSGGGHWRKPLT